MALNGQMAFHCSTLSFIYLVDGGAAFLKQQRVTH